MDKNTIGSVAFKLPKPDDMKGIYDRSDKENEEKNPNQNHSITIPLFAIPCLIKVGIRDLGKKNLWT